MPYRIAYSPAAQRAIKKLPARDSARILGRSALAIAPRPPGSLKLAGSEDEHRVRVGDYRIIYSVFDDEVLVVIVDVGNRRDVYRRR